jgi:hypothetical protein
MSSSVIVARFGILGSSPKVPTLVASTCSGTRIHVAFIVITVTKMDMTRIIITRRSDRLSLVEVGAPHRLSLNILIHSRRYSCYFDVLLSLHLLHLLDLLVLSLLELLVLSLLPQHSLLLLLSLISRDHHPLQVSCHEFLTLVFLFI